MKRKSTSSQRPTLDGKHKEKISQGQKRAHAERLEASRQTNQATFMNSLYANVRRQQAEANAAEHSEQNPDGEGEDERNASIPIIDQPPELIERHEGMPIVPNLDILDDEEFVDEDLTEEEPELTIMHRYLQAIQKRLQYETSPKFPALENKWLNEFLGENDWWIHRHQYRSICRLLQIQYKEEENEAAYFRKVYVWLPDVRWGPSCMPTCAKCGSNTTVRNNGFRDNHFGRRVVALDHDYYCISRRYRCNNCEQKAREAKIAIQQSAAANNIAIQFTEETDSGQQYSFMAWNRKTLELYPHGIGQEFPAFLTHRSGVDRLLLDMMRPLFDKGLRPGAFADTILELHAKRYHQECLKHELELAKTANRYHRPMLSAFGDTSKYNGLVPTGSYLMYVYKLFHSTIKDFLDTEVKKRGAKMICVDASYKEPKHLCQYHGQNLFKGLITVTNEIGEIRLQFHVVTDDHEQFRPSLIAFLETVKAYGQNPLELVFTDNVQADRQFYLDTFPSLAEAQARLDRIVTGGNEESGDEQDNTCTVDDDQFFVISERGEMNRFVTALDEIMQDKSAEDQVVGLDAEWNVNIASYGMPKKIGKLALLILAYKDSDGRHKAALLRLHKFPSLPHRLLAFLVGGTKFVGNYVGGDIKRLGRDYHCEDEMKKVSVVNLGRYARDRDVVQSGTVRLDALVQICLGETMQKQASVRVSSKWEQPSLSQDQKKYAALDGIKSLEVYLYLRQKPDLSVRLSVEEARAGLCIDVAPLRGGALSMVATRCATGTLTEQTYDEWEVPSDMRLDTGQINKRRYRVVNVCSVVAPHYIVPYVKKKESGGPVCLDDFGAPPFFVILPLTMLKQHIESDTIRPFPNMNPNVNNMTGATGGAIPPAPIVPPAPPAPPRIMQNQLFDQNETFTEEDTGQIGTMDQLDGDAETAAVNLSNKDVEMLHKVCLLGDKAALGNDLLACAHLDNAPDKITDCFSAVVGDVFHLMDRMKIPTHHEFKKAFKVALRDSVLQWSPPELEEVKTAVKAKDGKTDDEIDADMYFNAAFWKACVPRRVLPPRLLYWRVRAVFVSFGGMIDSTSKKPLFNKTAWKKANNILKEILRGYYSDPPGYSFYSTKFNKRGEPMVNAYGFDILSCRRGTNDVESTHKLLLSIFGTWHIGLQMSDCLLRERRHRHNQRCSEKRRLGHPCIGHYDTWLIDALQILVQVNHGILLHPNWINSSDFKNTQEKFGTITLHDAELAEALAKVQIDESVRLTHDMQYLCSVMGTKLPLLPVHTIDERRHFSNLVVQLQNGQDKSCKKMALEWTKAVNGVTIFPKLPVHLRNYRDKFERNAKVRQAFKDAQESREILSTLNKALCPEIEADEGIDAEDTPQQLDNYTRQWPAICAPPQLLLPLVPSAVEPGNIHVGGVLINKAPDIAPLDRIKKRGRGQRGPDNPRKGARPKRRCMLCKGKGETDDAARNCPGSRHREDCKHLQR